MKSLLLIFVVLTLIVIKFFFNKKPVKRSNVGKIYRTTDGYLSNNKRNKKRRNIIILEQRKKDNAVAIAKIEKERGKKKNFFVRDFVLEPKDHKSLKERSLVVNQPIWGIKIKSNNDISNRKQRTHRPIFLRNMNYTKDKLTAQELKTVKDGMYFGDTERYENVSRNWEKGFKKKK